MRRNLVGGVFLVAAFVAAQTQGNAQTETNVQTKKDVVYATHDGVALLGDLYLPMSSGRHPALMFIHGGGFRAGSKSAYGTSWGPYLAARGYVVFAIDYRLSKPGQPTYPKPVQDVRAAIQFVKYKADDLKAPAHGFVRTKSWQLESIAQTGDGVTVSMFTESDEDTKRWWPADFRLVYRVTFASELRLELVVTNTGKTSLRFEEALHGYHRVGNILNTRVGGLDTVHYIDKTDSDRKKIQHGEIAIVSETDRVYLNTIDAIKLEDPVLRRRTRVAKENSRTTVVWNPWVQKALSLSDFGDDEWMQMICIETSNVSDFGVDLAPGQQHRMTALVREADF